MIRGVRWRLEGEAIRRREARKCPPHPDPRRWAFWQLGDYATPDRLVCGRCFATLDERPHAPAAER